ncbi:PAS-domain containing protein [Psychrosphaera ytuae]|uniref:histidine kinase n=1 Tax=Psychrosphaera ytuae TaxID=2820710 RepID=A0A975DCA6_9GAMM|nr:PAS domain-containing hybrid sensor histidine kinase/response regulator [Psychrosphaera ytuae]QTH64476.1 PAS-domain containing protein [Psychrosphaera ytuae]
MLVWLSIDTWLVSLLALGFLGLLFFVAYFGQKHLSHWAAKPSLYTLAIAVSCSSWAFYGTVSQAAHTGYWLAPIYIGTIACFVLAWPMLLKLVRVSKQQNLTSVADFIACRYDKAPSIAAVISIIAVVGTLPYIALQLRAVSQSFDLVTGSYQSGFATTTIVTIVLIGFSVLFGVRHAEVNRQNPGLLIAIAFSSLFKLFVILAVGVFAVFYVFDGWESLHQQYQALPSPVDQPMDMYSILAQIILGFATIFITPQLFHMIAIENDNEHQLKQARWMYPGYLLLINLFILPIAMAGLVTFPGGAISPDTFMLTIPLYYDQSVLSLLVFLGGLAAASSMVIIASIVLSTLITTEIANPIILKTWRKTKQTGTDQPKTMGRLLLFIRRLVIAGILLLSLAFDQLITQQSELASLGLLSFVLLSQCAPAVVGALYWRNSRSDGALWGLIGGSVTWFYCLLIPNLWPESSIVTNGLFGIDFLIPTAMFGLDSLDPITHGLLMSLTINLMLFVAISNWKQPSLGESLLAKNFTAASSHLNSSSGIEHTLTYGDLLDLLHRFIDESAKNNFAKSLPTALPLSQLAKKQDIQFVQKSLSAILGTASTRLVLQAASQHRSGDIHTLDNVAEIVDEASRLYEFNRELLQAGVENIAQGISVIDADMKLVAWNQRYVELLEFPAGMLKAGMPIEDIIRYNAERDLLSGDDIQGMIDKRLAHMRQGHQHHTQRTLPSGVVIEIRGQAMPGGGFVSTFTDISRHIEAEKQLQQANELLEQRVAERTSELTEAKAEAENANRSKTRFLAAASHDLMQPFNALSLFTAMLKQKAQNSEVEELANNIEDSLQVVEELLTDLVEISKLDSGVQKVDIQSFPVMELLRPLENEFSAMAKRLGIEFSCVHSALWIRSDKRLLRRVLQNFLSNAFHYAPLALAKDPKRKIKVVIGVRRHRQRLRLDVIDNGLGIPNTKLFRVFKEFERLQENKEKPGLGLGLAICDRIADLLNAPIFVRSVPDKGICFGIDVEREVQPPTLPSRAETNNAIAVTQSQQTIAIIDNEPLIVKALSQQLEHWGFKVISGHSRAELFEKLTQYKSTLDLIVADYHLDDGDTGIEVVNYLHDHPSLTKLLTSTTPVIICSADPSETLRQTCIDHKYSFIRKPVKAPALKRKLKNILNPTAI